MTIDLNGITPEQQRLSKELLHFDISALKEGQGAWVNIDTLWADPEGCLYIDGSERVFTEDEVVKSCTDYDFTEEDYIYIFLTEQGLIVSVAHIPTIVKVDVHTKPSKELLVDSIPICGYIQDELTLEIVNGEFLREYDQKIPDSIPEPSA